MDGFQLLDWGIAGVLAGMIFLAYRNTIKQQREDRKYMEDRMEGIITNYHKDSKAATKSMVANTKIQNQLFTWLKGKNGHK